MTAGVLYPRSAAHPAMGTAFMDGLQAFLQWEKLNTRIIIYPADAGSGGSDIAVYQIAERLLLNEQVDVLVAFIDLKVLPLLKPLLHACGKLMIVVNAGANYPDNWVPRPNIVFLTLQHAFLCWLTGALTGGKPAALASTVYDSGYLHMAAMVKRFLKQGGHIDFNYINRNKYDETFQITGLAGYLSTRENAGSLLCVFDTTPAALFYNRLKQTGSPASLRLFVSPMMLEPAALQELPGTFPFSLEGFIPWSPALHTGANDSFMESYTRAAGRQPCIFAVLGWETGLILQQVMLCGTEKQTDGARLTEYLKNIDLTGPRGALQLDRETNHFLAPVLKCSVASFDQNMVVEEAGDTTHEWNSFVNEPPDNFPSGWTNTYLCY
jgi:branched-chain amino acid transport system substrate-binding protein